MSIILLCVTTFLSVCYQALSSLETEFLWRLGFKHTLVICPFDSKSRYKKYIIFMILGICCKKMSYYIVYSCSRYSSIIPVLKYLLAIPAVWNGRGIVLPVFTVLVLRSNCVLPSRLRLSKELNSDCAVKCLSEDVLYKLSWYDAMTWKRFSLIGSIEGISPADSGFSQKMWY